MNLSSICADGAFVSRYVTDKWYFKLVPDFKKITKMCVVILT